jgi:hypothetical protein
MLLVSDLVIGSPVHIHNAAFFARAFAQALPSKGDLVKGDVRPYGQLYILEIRRGAGDKVIGR